MAQRFSEQRKNVEDGERPRCPVTMKTYGNVENVRNLGRTGRRLGIRTIVEELNMEKEMVSQILTGNLNVKNCVPKWSQRIRQILATKQIPTLKHPPYSPDLATCDYFLFSESRISFKRTHFQSTEDIHKEKTELLNTLSQNDFRSCFEAFKASMEQCVASDGSCYVGDNTHN
jgi:hypothetical protein